jgi:hypothetical protein
MIVDQGVDIIESVAMLAFSIRSTSATMSPPATAVGNAT